MDIEEDIIRGRRDDMYEALTMFEASKRKIYCHCRYPLPTEFNRARLGGTSTRSEGAFHVRLEVDCIECDGQHTIMGKKSYIEWYSKIPFLCVHQKAVVGMEVELDREVARRTRTVFMPHELVRLEPDGVSESSAGCVDRVKLSRD